MTDEQDDVESILDRHVSQLMEHFDAVEVFVSYQQPGLASSDHPRGVTVSCHSGAGNIYARAGQIREWVVAENARIRRHAIRCEDQSEDD